ncbi:MAG: hypothetical protein U0841_29215 [Chloroflexia bacterium]
MEAEQALWLDAPDQAILTRVGPVPTPEEILAAYHLHLLDSAAARCAVDHADVAR